MSYEKADPYPRYARMRAETPVYRSAGPMGSETWMITRYEDVRAALTDPRLSKDPANAPRWLRDLGLVTEDGIGPIGRNLLSYDPPDHTRLRKLVAKAFTRRRMEDLRPRVQEITDELLDAMAGRDEADLIAALAFPLPITVICELLGVPAADRADFRRWSSAVVSAEFTEEGLAAQRAATDRMAAYIRDRIAERRALAAAGDADAMPDLIGALLAAADDEDRLAEHELISMIRLLLIAGHETTVNLIANGMLALLTHPDQLELLTKDRGLLPGAIEELLRYDGPVERATPRFAVEDVTYSGVTIPEGSHVTVVLAAADRDEAHVPDPDRLDITREGHGHVAFGHGIHFCLGAPLARIEGQVAIGSLLDRFPGVALAVPPGELRWRPGGPANIIRGLESLPLRL